MTEASTKTALVEMLLRLKDGDGMTGTVDGCGSADLLSLIESLKSTFQNTRAALLLCYVCGVIVADMGFAVTPKDSLGFCALEHSISTLNESTSPDVEHRIGVLLQFLTPQSATDVIRDEASAM